MHLTILDQVLWATTFVGDMILIGVLAYRHRINRFPLFTALIGLDVLRTVVLLTIRCYGTKGTYFYTYWSFALIDVVLQLGVLYQIAAHVFRPSGKWAKDTVQDLIYLILSSLVVAAALTWLPTLQVMLRLQVALLKGNFCSALLLSELSVGVFALSVRAGLSWSTHEARVMHGFIVYWLCTLGLETARAFFGVGQNSHAYQNLSHVRIAAYLLCMAYWIVTLWREEPPPRQMTDLMRQQLSAIRSALANKLEMRRGEVER